MWNSMKKRRGSLLGNRLDIVLETLLPTKSTMLLRSSTMLLG